MTDIDFDELDRAVNSLMQPKQPSSKQPQPKPEAAEPADKETVVEIPSSASDNQPSAPAVETSAPAVDSEPPVVAPEPTMATAEASADVPAPATESVTAPATPTEASTPSAPKAKVSTKRRGQFMDVMHTSSDMKQSDPAPKLAPRKSTVTLQPTTMNAQPTKPALVSEPVKQPDTEPTETTQSVQAEWTDPIDMMTRHEDKLAATETEEAAAKETPSEQPATPAAPATSLVDNDPPASPFLPDTKVDKRPLGGVQPTDGIQAEPVPDPELTDASPDSEQKADEPEATALPEELQQDVLAIEADMAAKANQEAVEASKQAEEAAAAALAEPAPKPTKPAKPVTNQVSTPATARQTSLPQSPPPVVQDADREPDSSIFDTEQYQAPIKHPAKRKSSWPVVVAIVALVVLGTGGGVAFYLLSNGY